MARNRLYVPRPSEKHPFAYEAGKVKLCPKREIFSPHEKAKSQKYHHGDFEDLDFRGGLKGAVKV